MVTARTIVWPLLVAGAFAAAMSARYCQAVAEERLRVSEAKLSDSMADTVRALEGWNKCNDLNDRVIAICSK
jgi:hypothetical protein